MTLYEINQAGYLQLPDMKESEIKTKTHNLTNFLIETNSQYYMLLNAEGRYYTIFTYKKNQDCYRMALEVIDLVKSLGFIKSIEIQDDRVEFWVTSEGEVTMYMLFDYAGGVIEV